MNVNLGGSLDQNVHTDFLSKIALVLAILSFMCCCIDWLFSIPAIICAIIALVKNRKDARAWAAIVIAGISIVFYIFAIITGLFESVLESANKKVSNKTELVSQESNSTTSSSINDTNANTNDKISVSNDRQTEQKELSYEIVDTQFYTFTNSIGNGEYFFVMEILNTGDCNLYLDECTVELEDASGHLLQAGEDMSSCPSIIRPGETGYFYNGIINTQIDDNVNVNDIANCVPTVEIEEARKEPVEYEVSDLYLSEEYGSAKVVGRITNTTNEDDAGIYINIIYFDAADKVLGIDGTNVWDIKAGQTVSFESSAMFMQGDSDYSDIASYKVIAQKDYYQW